MMACVAVKRQDPDAQPKQEPPHRGGVAFSLAQLGAHAAARFAERVAQIGLTPPLVGILRAISHDPGFSQQRLATRLGLLPSKMVALVDTLEAQGLLKRERSTTDRRQYALHLTVTGQATMRQIGRLARDHDRDLCTALDTVERDTLAGLLERVSDQQGLALGVHPGYRAMR